MTIISSSPNVRIRCPSPSYRRTIYRTRHFENEAISVDEFFLLPIFHDSCWSGWYHSNCLCYHCPRTLNGISTASDWVSRVRIVSTCLTPIGSAVLSASLLYSVYQSRSCYVFPIVSTVSHTLSSSFLLSAIRIMVTPTKKSTCHSTDIIHDFLNLLFLRSLAYEILVEKSRYSYYGLCCLMISDSIPRYFLKHLCWTDP